MAFSAVGRAQIPFANSPENAPNHTAVKTGGKSSFDLVRTSESALSIPLRYGNIIERSETVILEGRTLTRDSEYTMDYASGLVYLKIRTKPGQSVNVSYRYDETKSQEGVFGAATAPDGLGFGFQLSPGTRAMIGMGYTERMADGTVMSGNLFGLSNSFSLGGGGKVSGVMMMNNRENASATNLMGDDNQRGAHEEGQGMAIVQQLEAQALGGKLSIGYQDIDDRFAGFQSFASAGFSQDQVKAFAGEKGLKRTGFGLTGAKWGQMSFGGAHNSVGDSNGSITWRSAEASLAGVSLNWNSLVVDPGFNKFNGLREADRAQLQKERGMERQNFNLTRKVGKDSMIFDFSSVTNSADDQGLWRSNFALSQGWITGKWSRQSVDENFFGFNNIREADRGQLAKERGIDRNSYELALAPGYLKANYLNNTIDAIGGSLTARDFNLSIGGWGLEYRNRGIDQGFYSQGSLTGEDRNQFNDGVVKMYGADTKLHGNDNAGLNSTGFDRTGMRLTGSIWNYKTVLNQVTIDHASGTIKLNEFSMNRGKTSLNISNQTSTDGFNAAGSLFHTERQRLSDINGLDKTNIGFSTEFGKNARLALDWMTASDPLGKAFRQKLDYSQTGINFSFARRSVDQGFTSVGRMMDSEKGLMGAMLGFDQTEMIANYNPGGIFNFGYRQSDFSNSIFDETRKFREFSAGLNLSKNTSIGFSSAESLFTNDGLNIIDSKYSGVSLNHNMGSGGTLSLSEERHQYNGTDQQMPDAQKRSLAYERQLNSKTKFRTEQSETLYEDGQRETESRNKVSTQLNSRIGVSVEDQQIRRDGDAPDETRRNYGFWVDFGKGIRFDYGYNRDIRGEAGTMNSTTTLSGGEFGGLKLGGATYKTNRWDGTRQQHFGNVSFSNTTPFELGMFKDIKFNYSTETQRDFLAWQKELINMGVSSSVGQIGIGWNYNSQVHTDGVRAIDRAFSLTTDKTGKAPFRATLKYGVRTTPNDESVMIRDYALNYQANKFLSVEHALVTNPLQNRGGVLLGSAPLDEQRSSWTAKYQNDPKLKFDLSWNEMKRDNVNDALRREARFNATLFADKASPMQLTYALQQWHRNGSASLAHSYGISFTQRPGPNQSFSFGIEHLQWGQGRPSSSALRDWKLRFDFSSRF